MFSLSEPCQYTVTNRVIGGLRVLSEWDDRLAAWRDELDLLAKLDDAPWVPLAIAEAEAGVSRSALRAWYRNGEIASRLVDGPHGPQRLVPPQAEAGSVPRLERGWGPGGAPGRVGG